ncbi:MAG: antibiotic biosynthesis monooxygenase family protein [Actinomycetota bacterium]
MSYVVINAIEVPEGSGGELEDRFANRAGEVSKSDGFESFQLLRPDNEGAGNRYLVYTRWSDKASFEKWMGSSAFQKGHAQSGEGRKPVATTSQVWLYEVAQFEEL